MIFGDLLFFFLNQFALFYRSAVIGNQGQQGQAGPDAAPANNQQPAAAENQQAVGGADGPVEDGERPPVGEGQQEPGAGDVSNQEGVHQEQQAAVVAWYDMVVTFVTTFFTSMVPDPNDPQAF